MSDCGRYEIDIIDYIDGELEGERLHALLEHLCECGECCERVRMMRFLMDETAELETEPPALLHGMIMKRTFGGSGKFLKFLTRRTAIAAAILFLLICAGSVYVALNPMSKNDLASGSLNKNFSEDSKSSENAVYAEDNADQPVSEPNADTNEGDSGGGNYYGDSDKADYDKEITESAAQLSPGAIMENLQNVAPDILNDEGYSNVIMVTAASIPKALSSYDYTEEDGLIYITIPNEKADEIVGSFELVEVSNEVINSLNAAVEYEILNDDSEYSLVVLCIKN